jgi:hypothetical protein
MITLSMETEKFNLALKKFMLRSNISEDKVIRKVAFDLLSNMLQPEPYGKYPVDLGQSRAGWYASVVGLGKKFDFDSRVKGESKVNEGKAQSKFKSNLTGSNKYVEMINGVNHTIFLEYGHSRQAPAGFIRISMRKMRGKLPKELGEAYKKDWNAIGKGKASAFGSTANLIQEYREFGD